MKTTTKKPSTKKSFNEPREDRFITKILENLDLVKVSEWEQYTNLTEAMPTNLFTQKPYAGFNVLALTIDSMVRGFSTMRYATFKSIAEAGGILKKGSKGCLIEFFTFIYKY